MTPLDADTIALLRRLDLTGLTPETLTPDTIADRMWQRIARDQHLTDTLFPPRGRTPSPNAQAILDALARDVYAAANAPGRLHAVYTVTDPIDATATLGDILARHTPTGLLHWSTGVSMAGPQWHRNLALYNDEAAATRDAHARLARVAPKEGA